MNVVTIGYLAVLRDVGTVVGGSDAAAAALIPASDVLNGKVELAFDHLRIVRDAIERARVELQVTGIATAFVGPRLHPRRAAGRRTRRSGGPARRRELQAKCRRVSPLGDPHRAAAPGPARPVGGPRSLPGRAGVAPRRTDPPHPRADERT